MESNLPLGKVWLKTPQNQELKMLVSVTADNVLSLLYILLGSTQKEGNSCRKGLKRKSFSPFPWAAAHWLPEYTLLCSNILSEPPPAFPLCSGHFLVPLPEKENIYWCWSGS